MTSEPSSDEAEAAQRNADLEYGMMLKGHSQVAGLSVDPDLFLSVLTCDRCELAKLRVERSPTAKAVPGELGNEATSPLLAFIAEAPGAQEEKTGHPLVGPSGRIFARLLKDAGVKREEVLIMNRVRCRPPNNDLKSHPAALENCDYWTQEEFKAYDPKVVVAMGLTVIKALFGSNATVGETRGKPRQTGEDFIYGARLWVPTYHPGSLLPIRRPQNYGLVLEDIKLAVEELHNL